ncbi:MAG: ABC transporter permease [Actinomycetota bacterium]
MSTFTGSWRVIRLVLRRDRSRLAIWAVVLSLVPIASSNALASLYATETSRQQLAATVRTTPAFTALLGPLYDAGIGGLTAWRVGTLGAVFVGLMAVLTMIRHTREEEETGRRELLGSTVVGRQAPLAAAMLVTLGAGLAIGLILLGGLVGLGLPFPGSLGFGLGFALVAAAFAGLGALAAQLTESASAARGIAVGMVGVFFLLRMGGDAGESSGLGWLAWLSPIGWFSRLRPFAGEEWGVLGLWIALSIGAGGTAFLVSSRRDIGAGAFPPRPGPASAGRLLSTPMGLAWRLQRGSLVAWTVGLGAIGAVYGASGASIGDLLEGSPQLVEILGQLGGEQSLTDTFFSVAIGSIALVTCSYAIRSVLRLRVEEEGLRAEPILATATPRLRWAGSHLVFGLIGPLILLVVAGALAGAVYGLIIGDVAGQVPRVVKAALIQIPAVWVLTGVAMFLFALAPRLVGWSWGVLAGCLILGQLGQILQFPQWALNLSPFTHIPLIPAEPLEVLPLAVLLLLAAALIAAGSLGFLKRDIEAR